MIAFLVLLALSLLLYVLLAGPRLPAETDDVIEDVLRSGLPEIVTGKTGFVSSAGLRIWYELVSPRDPPAGTIVLLAALGGHALEWMPTFVQDLLDAGYQVLRFD